MDIRTHVREIGDERRMCIPITDLDKLGLLCDCFGPSERNLI